MGTSSFAVPGLELLLEDEHFEVVGVISQPDRPSGRKLKLQPSPVSQVALQNHLPLYRPVNVNEPSVIESIVQWRAESAVVIAYGQILSDKLIQSFNLGVVNVHASLLPRWRGAAPIQRAIEAGDKETGVTLQIIGTELDAGPILGYKNYSLDNDFDAVYIHDHLAFLSRQLLHIEYMDYLRGNLAGINQNESFVTYAKKIRKSEAQLDWNYSAQVLHNKVRAFKLGPGTFFVLQGKKVKVLQTKVSEKFNVAPPGEVIAIQDDFIWISTPEGALGIYELQMESRKKQRASEFIRGYSIQVGQILV